MKQHIRTIFLYGLLFVVMITVFSGCKSTETRDGVTIEKQSGNPIKFW